MSGGKNAVRWIVLSVLFLTALTGGAGSAGAATYWWKIAPATCAIYTYDSDIEQVDNHEVYAGISLYQFNYAIGGRLNCPVALPQGAAVNLLRIRDFQAGGLPANTSVTVKLNRVKWDGSGSTLGTSSMSTSGATYADASISSTVDNENYQYYLEVYLYSTNSQSYRPQLNMIEIRYTL